MLIRRCPQCNNPMESERSMTPTWKRTVLTTHYRCEECDAEYVNAGYGVEKIDGATVALDVSAVLLNTEEPEDSKGEAWKIWRRWN